MSKRPYLIKAMIEWINDNNFTPYILVDASVKDVEVPENFIKNDQTILEKEPLEKVAAMGELMAYHHDDFWQCMDTKRDRDNLENLWISGDAPWRH